MVSDVCEECAADWYSVGGWNVTCTACPTGGHNDAIASSDCTSELKLEVSGCVESTRTKSWALVADHAMLHAAML